MKSTLSFEHLIPGLVAIATRLRADKDEAVSIGWLMWHRSVERGQGSAWIFAATYRVLKRELRSCGMVSIDEIPDGQYPLVEVLAAGHEELECWRTAELTDDVETLVHSGTLGLAQRQGVTRRRAQQIMSAMIKLASEAGGVHGYRS